MRTHPFLVIAQRFQVAKKGFLRSKYMDGTSAKLVSKGPYRVPIHYSFAWEQGLLLQQADRVCVSYISPSTKRFNLYHLESSRLLGVASHLLSLGCRSPRFLSIVDPCFSQMFLSSMDRREVLEMDLSDLSEAEDVVLPLGDYCIYFPFRVVAYEWWCLGRVISFQCTELMFKWADSV